MLHSSYNPDFEEVLTNSVFTNWTFGILTWLELNFFYKGFFYNFELEAFKQIFRMDIQSFCILFFWFLYLNTSKSSILTFKRFYIRTATLYFSKSEVLVLESAFMDVRKLDFFSLRMQLPKSWCSISFIISRVVRKTFGFKHHL